MGTLDGGVYTSHGLMLPSDLEEYRRDTDWSELHRPVPEDGQCEHARWPEDDCDGCGRPALLDDEELTVVLDGLHPTALRLIAAQFFGVDEEEFVAAVRSTFPEALPERLRAARRAGP